METLRTPYIDSLAKSGIWFSRGYAANATCAPSRASIMTGKYPTRFGFEFTSSRCWQNNTKLACRRR